MKTEDGGQIELNDQMLKALTAILDSERAVRGKMALCHTRPNDWVRAASLLVQGISVLKVSKEVKIDRNTGYAIQGLVLTSDDSSLFRKMKSEQIAVKSMQVADLESKILDNLLDGSELSDARIRQMGPKEIQLLSIASKVDMESFDRITGNNVQRIEVKHITTPEEAMKLIEELPSVEIEEV